MQATQPASIARLRTRFHLGALLFIVATALAMQYLLDQYADARAQTYLAGFRINAELKTKQIDLRFRLLADHVLRLRTLTERAFSRTDLPEPPALLAASRQQEIVGYGLPTPAQSAQPYGNFLAHAPLGSDEQKQEYRVAWQLFPLMAAQHQLDDSLRWSGIVSFHSGNFAAYPYQSVPDFLAGAKEQHIRDALLNQYGQEFITTLKQQFSNSHLLWRSPSFDQAGTGYIVSIFAPVYFNGRLQSYVLADVQLNFIVKLLRDDLPLDMHVQIVTAEQELIADSDGTQPSTLRSNRFHHMPAQAAATVGETERPEWQLKENHYELKLPLGNVSWLSQTVIDSQRIDQLVANDILPLRKAQIFLTALVALIWWLLSRFFVTPSLLLAEMATYQDVAREPRLPRIWHDAKAHLRKLIVERRIAIRTLETERAQLEVQVRERTRELQNQNTELEAFNFAVSHDLRAPLRAIDGFVGALQEDYGERLDETGRRYVQRAKAGVTRMEELIEALLALSQLSRVPLQRETVNLSELASEIMQELTSSRPERKVTIHIEAGLQVQADQRLIRAAMENLLTNAWKYSSKTANATIQFYTEQHSDETVYVVADNGAGFDMHYADRLFTPFQRMHRQDEFTGTGVGLSTVQRIIHRHGGRIWAEAEVDKGAKFRFTLP